MARFLGWLRFRFQAENRLRRIDKAVFVEIEDQECYEDFVGARNRVVRSRIRDPPSRLDHCIPVGRASIVLGLLESRRQSLLGHRIIGSQAQLLSESCDRRREISQTKPAQPEIVPGRHIIRPQVQDRFVLGDCVV